MPKSLQVTSLLLIALVTYGCGRDATAPALTPEPTPANLVITGVSVTYDAWEFPEMIAIGVVNTGGPGTYYVELLTGAEAQSRGAPRSIRSEALNVPTGFSQVLDYWMEEFLPIEAVKVFTRPKNTNFFLLTGCRVLRADISPGTHCP